LSEKSVILHVRLRPPSLLENVEEVPGADDAAGPLFFIELALKAVLKFSNDFVSLKS
jgi:hypothetical protein